MTPPGNIVRDYDPTRRGFFYHVSAGLRFLFLGYRLLFAHPRLLALSLVPILLTLVALIFIVSGVVTMVGWLIGPELNPFSVDLRRFAQALVLVVALFVSYVLYLPLARIFLAPFSEAISRRTRLVLGLEPEPTKVGWLRAMAEGAKLVLLQLCMVLFGLGLGLVFPPIAGAVGLTIAICFVSLDYLDVPLSVKGLTLRRKLGVLGRNKAVSLGFGAAGYLTLIIPVVNLLSLPVGVIGATTLVHALNPERQEASSLRSV